MKPEEQRELTALYATWDTASLTDAATNHSAEYAPEALKLIAEELLKRGVTLRDDAPVSSQGVRQWNSATPVIRLARTILNWFMSIALVIIGVWACIWAIYWTLFVIDVLKHSSK